MSLAKLQKTVNSYYNETMNAGKARRATVQGKSVIVDGRPYPVDVAVPVSMHDGAHVYVHISNNRATVIGA